MQKARPIKVLVIHNNAITRAGLHAAFAQYPDIELLGTLENAGVSPSGEAVSPEQADVVVGDYDSAMALVEGSRSSRKTGKLSRVMIVTRSDRESDIRHALGRGVGGYMLLDSQFDELAHGVRDVHAGIRALSRRIAQQLAESLTGEQLTAREMDVLRLLIDGHGNKLIAKNLDIGVATVKSHMESIFKKLEVDSRTQAMAVAERRGLVPGTGTAQGLEGWPGSSRSPVDRRRVVDASSPA